MKKILLLALLYSWVGASHPVTSLSEDPQDFIGIREHLQNSVPGNLRFTDADQHTFVMGEKITKPVLLSIVYYRCPGICSPLLKGMVKWVDDLDLEPGRDYQILTVSMDATETTELAFKKRKTHFEMMEKKKNPSGWIWAVGEVEAIKTLTDAVGFHYKKTPDGNFAHAGVLTFLDKNLKIVRYLHGIDFRLFDIKMALTEAMHNTDPTLLSRFKLFLFPYSIADKSYELRIDRLLFLLLLPFIFYFASQTIKKK